MKKTVNKETVNKKTVNKENRQGVTVIMRTEIEKKMKETADFIFRHPELSLHEKESSARLAEFLESEGFAVSWNLAGFETAFVAEWGGGKPAIGFLAEYDALPGLGQKP